MSIEQKINEHMQAHVTMRQACLKQETMRLGLEQALALARQHVQAQNGWLLAEAPERLLWLPLAEASDMALPEGCASLVIFGPEAELRFHRRPGAAEGDARLISQDAQGQPGLERVSAYLLAKGPGKLEYAEFFRQDEASGLLKLEFARCCGVRGA